MLNLFTLLLLGTALIFGIYAVGHLTAEVLRESRKEAGSRSRQPSARGRWNS